MPLLEQVLGQFPKGVRIVFKNYPLSMHKFALSAAIAGLAAQRQGKFWPFHDKVFENYNKLDENKLLEIAKEVGLNLKAFEAARKDPALRALVERDVREGNAAGVRGTPTVYINGRLLKDRSINGFRVMIERELRRASARSK